MFSKLFTHEEQLTYDDVLIIPRRTTIRSRQDVDLTTNLGASFLKYPVMSAAMDTVTGGEMAEALDRVGAMGVVHRFQSVEDRIESISPYCYSSEAVGIAVGLDETEEEIHKLSEVADVIALDVAHAHADYVIERTRQLSNLLTNWNGQLMVGNIVTRQAAWELIEAGADILKVGIGGGSACSTRIVTGMGYPNISAIIEVRTAITDHNHGKGTMLVADGGIRNSGDIAKAIAAGADCVMLGGLLAGCDESPGELVSKQYPHEDEKQKMFRGMASKSAQEDWKGGLKEWTVAEGVTSYVDATGPVKDTVENLMGGLRSAFTYADAKTIKEFQKNTQFVRVTANCLSESKPRV